MLWEFTHKNKYGAKRSRSLYRPDGKSFGINPKGFGDYWKVYDKVGFRDQDEYHDVAIVVTPRGKTYIVSVLSSGAGTANIADLANTLKKSMTE